MHLPFPLLAACLASGLVGALVGRALRAFLARLPRGTVVGAGWCEAGLGLAWAGTALAVTLGSVPPGRAPELGALAVLAVGGTATDVLTGRLPNAITLPGAPVLLAALTPLGGGSVAHGAVGALLLGVAFAGVHLASPSALGAGDVKLAVALGAPLGAASWVALALAPTLAALSLAAAAAAARRRRLPYGPALLGASCVVVVASA